MSDIVARYCSLQFRRNERVSRFGWMDREMQNGTIEPVAKLKEQGLSRSPDLKALLTPKDLCNFMYSERISKICTP